jgi:hypothetical protein
MKSTVFISALFVLCLLSPLSAQNPGWSTVSQTASDPSATSFGNQNFTIGCDNQNNLITAGYASSRVFLDDTILYPETPSYPFYSYLWKQDANSNTVFIRKFDGVALNTQAIYTDSGGNIYLSTIFFGDIVFEGESYQGSDGDLIVKFDPQGNLIWVRQCRGGNFAVTANGYCFVSGFFTGSITIGETTLTSAGREDMFIARLSSDGIWEWVKRFGTATGGERCYQVAPLSNGEAFIAGTAGTNCDFDGHNISYNRGGLFLAKLNSLGECTWVEGVVSHFYSNDVYFSSIATNNPSEVYIYYDVIEEGHPLISGMFVKKVNPNGWDPVTILQIDRLRDVRSRKMLMDSAGNLYLTGYYYDPFTLGNYHYAWESGDFLCKLNHAGAILWSYDHGPCIHYQNPSYRDVCVSNSGSVFLSMYTYRETLVQPFSTYAGRGSYALKFTAAGQPEWMCSNWIETKGTEATDISHSLDGSAFVCGNFEKDSYWGNNYLRNRGSEGNDIYVARLNAANEIQWAVCAGGEAEDTVSAIYMDPNLNCYITGKFSGTMHFGDISIQSAGSGDIFVAKLDGQGNWLWAFAAGGAEDDAGLAIFADWQDNIYVSGYFSATASFGDDLATALGAKDSFVLKLDPAGNYLAVLASGTAGTDVAPAIICSSQNYMWVARNISDAAEQSIELQKLNYNLEIMDTVSSTLSPDLAINALSLDVWGNCLLTGVYSSGFSLAGLTLPNQANLSSFVLKLGSSFEGLWANYATAATALVANSIFTDAQGEIFIAGYMDGQGSFGSQQLYSWGMKDIFVAGLSSAGEWTWAKSTGSLADDCANALAGKPGGLCTVVGRFDGRIGMDNNWRQPMNEYESFVGELSFNTENPEEHLVTAVPGLLVAYPNPFSDMLQLTLQLKQADEISLKIYNLKGQLVRKLTEEKKAAGNHDFSWDGLSDTNSRCAAGIYLVQVKGAKTNLMRKVLKY